MKYFSAVALLSLLLLISCSKDEENSTPNVVCPFDDCCNNSPLLYESEFGKIYIPNIITPNGDGFNDQFAVLGRLYNMNRAIKKVKIYDSDRHVIQQTTDRKLNEPIWDGDYIANKYVGFITYEIQLEITPDSIITLEGKTCVISCTPDECTIDNINIENCKFNTQHNGEGEYDPNLPAYEENQYFLEPCN